MKDPLRQIFVSAALVLAGNVAWAHDSELEVAAQRFEDAARVMRHGLHDHYGRSHLTRGARLLARQARVYLSNVHGHRPPRRAYRDFAELARRFKHFQHDWRWRPVGHGGGRLEHAAVNLRRTFYALRQAQRDQAYVGKKRRHDWEIGS